MHLNGSNVNIGLAKNNQISKLILSEAFSVTN